MDDETNVLKWIEGLKAADPQDLAEYQRTMTDEVIPEIIRAVEERRIRAAESREWQLKC